MRKLTLLVVMLSLVIGVNAANLKEEIYNSNPVQFEELKQVLKKLNTEQTQKAQEAQRAFEKQQEVKAIKAIFADKEILKNYRSAIIKDGVILKLSRSNEEDGINFWYENAQNTEPTEEATCHIYEPTWENINADSPCGVTKYQLTEDSIYNAIANDLSTPSLQLLPYTDEDADTLTGIGSNDIQTTPLSVDTIHVYDVASPDHNSLNDIHIRFVNNQVITDSIAFAGYIESFAGRLLILPEPERTRYASNSMLSTFNSTYRTTEFSYEGHPILTLKSGRYINLLSTGRSLNGDVYFILKWFPMTVENHYLDDVSVKENDKENLVNIGYNNREITIDLADSVNPTNNYYELYDISGKLVERIKLYSHQTVLSMPKVSSGIYVIRVKGKNLSASKKVSFII